MVNGLGAHGKILSDMAKSIGRQGSATLWLRDKEKIKFWGMKYWFQEWCRFSLTTFLEIIASKYLATKKKLSCIV